MHLDDEQIQRVLHGELAVRFASAVGEHLAACGECQRRVDEAKREEDEIHTLLRRVDHRAPDVDLATIVARARPLGDKAGWARGKTGWVRWAAGIVLAVGLAGVAYAAPGSPLRAGMRVIAGWVSRTVGRPPAPPVLPPEADPSAGTAGVAVVPGQQLVIAFTTSHAGGRATVSLTDGNEVVVRALAGTAAFTSDVDRLIVENHDSSAAFEIQIPRAAAAVEIRVDGERIFRKEGPRVTAGHGPDSVGTYVLPLGSPGS